MESLRDRNQFQEHTHPLIETSSHGSYSLQEFDLDNMFYF